MAAFHAPARPINGRAITTKATFVACIGLPVTYIGTVGDFAFGPGGSVHAVFQEFAKRARPRHFCTKMISHSPL